MHRWALDKQAEFSLRIKRYRRVPTPLRSTFPFSGEGIRPRPQGHPVGVALSRAGVRLREDVPVLRRPQMGANHTGVETRLRVDASGQIHDTTNMFRDMAKRIIS